MYKKIVVLIVWLSLMFPVFGFANSDTLIVGTNAEFPPFTSIEKGQIIGFDIDIAKEVCKRLGKVAVFKDMPFDALIPETILGHIDFVAAGISITEERAKRVLFTKPYLNGDPLVILTNEALKNVITLEDLSGKTVVVNEGFTADIFLSPIKGIKLVRLPTTADAFLALTNKRVDAFVTAKSTFDTFKKNRSHPFYASPIEGTAETCALMVPKSKPELLKAIQKALDDMEADGTLLKIKENWGL